MDIKKSPGAKTLDQKPLKDGSISNFTVMKKKLFAFWANTILLFTIALSSNAQNSNSAGKPDLHSFNDTIYAAFHEKNTARDSGSLRLNERNSNAVRSFARDFRNVPDVSWIKSEKGFL
jgi:hypothetical protein